MKASIELGYAQGMVARRELTASRIGTEKSRAGAEMTFRSMLGCVKEVSKHRNNIGNMIDNESAGFYLQAGELLEQSKLWADSAKDNLARWGASDADIERIVGEVFGDA
jgi:hypothetical protein